MGLRTTRTTILPDWNKNDDNQSNDEYGNQTGGDNEEKIATGRNDNSETDDDDGSDGEESAKNNESTLLFLLRECEKEIRHLLARFDEQQNLKTSIERRLENLRTYKLVIAQVQKLAS
jgi:hypothetical protein